MQHRTWWSSTLNPKVDQNTQGMLALALFWQCGGRTWKDQRGYHAVAVSKTGKALELIQGLLGGKVWYDPKRKYYRWRVEKKGAVEWLIRNMDLLFVTPPAPDHSTCRHCGQEEGYHEQECPEAPGE